MLKIFIGSGPSDTVVSISAFTSYAWHVGTSCAYTLTTIVIPLFGLGEVFKVMFFQLLSSHHIMTVRGLLKIILNSCAFVVKRTTTFLVSKPESKKWWQTLYKKLKC